LNSLARVARGPRPHQATALQQLSQARARQCRLAEVVAKGLLQSWEVALMSGHDLQ
jgi:hypothetical protein